jgi:hypothetical protein
MSAQLYDLDFYAWANEQAELLRAGKLSEADLEHIAEEIESMGKTEKRELVSRLTVLLLHLLKWQFQPEGSHRNNCFAPRSVTKGENDRTRSSYSDGVPERRGKSWRNSVEVQRIRLASHLADNPSLKAKLAIAIGEAYRLARLETENETGIDKDIFPATCPWSFEQMMAEDFWPGSA